MMRSALAILERVKVQVVVARQDEVTDARVPNDWSLGFLPVASQGFLPPKFDVMREVSSCRSTTR